MTITIDFDKKLIDYPDTVKLTDLANYLVRYFGDPVWQSFKVTIHGDKEDGINEDTDTTGQL